METVGLAPEMAQRYPAQLSGGQQQRVGVARALAADPPVLLMDEPFSAVDPVVRESLQDELLRLQSELGKTIVFVTHDIDEAVKLGDKVAVLRVGGKLAQYDDPGDPAVAARRRLRRRVRRARPGLPRPGLHLRRGAAGRADHGGAGSARGRRAGGSSSTARAGRRAGCRPAPRPPPSTSCPVVRCTTSRRDRCAARSTPRCRRRPARASPSTPTAASPARSRPTTCCGRSRRSARPRRPDAAADSAG